VKVCVREDVSGEGVCAQYTDYYINLASERDEQG
jgi:hypothetical protein